MTARSAIFAALGPKTPCPISEIAQQSAALLHPFDGYRPQPLAATPAEAFFRQVTSPKIGATIERIRSFDAIPERIKAYYTAHNIALSLVIQREENLRNLNWAHSHISIAQNINEAAGLMLAHGAVAETGSIIFQESKDTSILLHFLAAVAFIVVKSSQIAMYLEEFETVVHKSGTVSANLYFITGASGTTDIGGELVMGAHGPKAVHIFLLETA